MNRIKGAADSQQKQLAGTAQTPSIGLIPRVLIALLTIAVLQGMCFSPVHAQEKEIKDEEITLAVDTALLHDDAVLSHLVDVETDKGVVTLSGTVDHLLAKQRALKVTESVKGVRSVVNRIKVKPVVRSDSRIRVDVTNALLDDPATDSYEIFVEVNDGVVTLTGTVESWQEKSLCVEVAKGVKGVKEIKDKIDIEYRSKRSDAEIKPEIERHLESDVWIEADLIDVKVEDGEVTLSGSVGSAAEKRWAATAAWVAGVTDVDNSDLKVEWWAQDKMEREIPHPIKSDEKIKGAVKDAFLYDPRVLSFHPSVEVNGGVVTLTGTVDNLRAKKAAEADAKNTLGVWRVKNYLKVRPKNPPADSEITQNVRDALLTDPYVERYEIDIYTISGTVYLSGEVDTTFEKRHAEDVAARVKGVIDVKNRLKVADAWVWKPDWEIKADIEDQLFWSPLVDGDDIEVSVEDSVATLTGTVDSWRERGAATDNAYDGGAKHVNNRLKVQNNGTFDDSE